MKYGLYVHRGKRILPVFSWKNRMVGPASCGEMLWQLFVAACGLQQRDKIVPTSVNFFTGFRKNNFSSSDVNEGMPEKAANSIQAKHKRNFDVAS